MSINELAQQKEIAKNDSVTKYVFDKKQTYYKKMVWFIYISVVFWIAIITLTFCAFFINGEVLALGFNTLFLAVIIVMAVWFIILIIFVIYLKSIASKEYTAPNDQKPPETSDTVQSIKDIDC